MQALTQYASYIYIMVLINEKLPAERIQKLLGGSTGRGYLTTAGLRACPRIEIL